MENVRWRNRRKSLILLDLNSKLRQFEFIQAEKKTKNRRKIAQMVCSRIAIDLNLDLIRRAVRRLDFDVTRWKLGMIENIFTGTFCMMPTIISYSLTLIIYNQYLNNSLKIGNFWNSGNEILEIHEMPAPVFTSWIHENHEIDEIAEPVHPS